MRKNTRKLGAYGEQIAINYLNTEKYQILKSNFHSRFGEIDIIAQKENTIIFIEVKTRTSNTFGTPEESLTPQKRRKIIKTALTFLKEKAPGKRISWRIDLIAVKLTKNLKTAQINHLKNI